MQSDDINPTLIGYKLRIWKNNQLLFTNSEHYSSIRSLSRIRYVNQTEPVNDQIGVFISSANDGSVKIWNQQCQCLLVC